MKIFVKSLFLLAVTMPSTSYAGDAQGKIKSIFNSFWTGDNFVVELKPGWQGKGCGNNKNKNSTITFAYQRTSSNNQGTYERNYSMALAAMAANKTVALYSIDNKNGGCEGYGMKVYN